MGIMFKTTNLSIDGLRHGFMSREGGVSPGLYASLNGAFSSRDAPDNVVENRRRAVLMVGLGPAPLITCSQVHSADVVRVDGPWAFGSTPKADALVTQKPGLALGVLTADCTPVLFADPQAHVVGAAHAGWTGAVNGVLEATIAAMIDMGATPQGIHAAIGPCIHQASYEVGFELRDRVVDQSPWADPHFKNGKAGHFYFDLPGYVSQRLRRASLQNIELVDIDTYRHEDKCFSYRRTTHHGGGDYGRALSIIGLED